MDLTCEERPSDSPYIERVWRNYSSETSPFISMAETHWGIAITRHQGKAWLTVRGPETKASIATGPADAEFMGIMFKPGAFMPDMSPGRVMDRQDINLPEASNKSFWLAGGTWQLPDYENAETFVDWLARDGLLVYDPVVNAVLEDQPLDLSLRTMQRRFLNATGMTLGTVRQIERARLATTLLKGGSSILDAVYEAGYADQAHMTRSLKHFAGQTPAQIISQSRRERLSFLFNTNPF